MTPPNQTEREWVEAFLATGVGPQPCPDFALGIACARFLNDLGPDPTSERGESAMEFVREIAAQSDPTPPAERVERHRGYIAYRCDYCGDISFSRDDLTGYLCAGSDEAHRPERITLVPPSNPADDPELVERVARALCRQVQISRTPKQRPTLFEELGEPGQDFWLAEARVALQPEQPDHGIEP